jgi:hypothetical protein
MQHYFLALILLGLGCSPPRPAEGVWRPPPGGKADRIPGPINIKSLGPFEAFPDALKAACPLILSRPNAAVGHIADKNLALRISTQYCAWLYYTPDHKYELSMLSDSSAPGDHLSGRTTCYLPPLVDDPRYAPASIRYIFALHNHPFAGELSEDDIYLAVEMANTHAWFVRTRDTGVHFSTIAFFSRSSDGEKPSCDGFYQYAPGTDELLLWTTASGKWGRKKIGTVVWTGGKFTINRAGR